MQLSNEVCLQSSMGLVRLLVQGNCPKSLNKLIEI